MFDTVSMHEVVIPYWFAVQIHYYNADDGCTFLFVECCRVGPAQTGGAFTFGVCLNLKLLFVFDIV